MSASRLVYPAILLVGFVVWSAPAVVAAPGVLSPKGSGAAVLPNVLLVVAPGSTASPVNVDGFYVPQGTRAGARLVKGTVFRVIVALGHVSFAQPLDIRIGCPVHDPTAKAMSQSRTGLYLMQLTSTGWKSVHSCIYDTGTRIASATVSDVYTGTIFGLGQPLAAPPAAASPHPSTYTMVARSHYRLSRKVGHWVRRVMWKPSVKWVYVTTHPTWKRGARAPNSAARKTGPALAIPPQASNP